MATFIANKKGTTFIVTVKGGVVSASFQVDDNSGSIPLANLYPNMGLSYVEREDAVRAAALSGSAALDELTGSYWKSV